MKRYRCILAVVFLILRAGSTLAATPPPFRTLHFPDDRSLGTLKNLDRLTANYSSSSSSALLHWWWGHFPWMWEELSVAKGEVTVPENKRLGLVVEPQGWKDLSPLANLAPDDIEVLGLHCERRALDKPGDECLAHICSLTGLKTLFLENTSITNEGLASLKKLKSLERLYVSSDQLDSVGIAHIAEVKSLKGLRLGTEHIITSRDLLHLARLTSLEELFIGWRGFEADGLAHLSRLPSLQFLFLNGGEIGPEGLVHLGKLPSLRRLEFYDLRGESFAALPDMPSLKELTIQRKGAEFVPLADLARLTGLESLSLSARFTDDGLAQLKGLRSLKKIGLHGLMQDTDYITDEGLAHLKEIKSLESVSIYTGRFTDKGLEYLSELKHLKELEIPNSSGFTDAGLQHIAKLNHLESLYLRGELLTEEGMSQIAKLTNLKSLRLLTARELTNEGLAKLGALRDLRLLEFYASKVTVSGLNQLNVLANMTELIVRGIAEDDSVLNLSGLTQLEHLQLSGVGDDDLACLAQLKRLKKLKISGRNTITNAGLERLDEVPSLTELEMGPEAQLKVTDEAIARLKETMPRLRYRTWGPFKQR